jgi:hypothetical protein
MNRIGRILLLFAMLLAPAMASAAVFDFQVGTPGGSIYMDSFTGDLVGQDIPIAGFTRDGGPTIGLTGIFLQFLGLALDPAVPGKFAGGYISIADLSGFSPLLMFGSLGSASLTGSAEEGFLARGSFLSQLDPIVDGSLFFGERNYSGTFEIAFGFDEAGAPVITSGRVTAVPEPGTMLMLGSGLIGLVGFGRRRHLK